MAAWLSLDEAFGHDTSPDPSPRAQCTARHDAGVHGGVSAFLTALAQGRDRGDQRWRSRAACRGQSATFYPAPVELDVFSDGSRRERRVVKFGRPAQLREMFAYCAECPVYGECRAARLRLGGADKEMNAAGLTWNQCKELGADTRRAITGAPMRCRFPNPPHDPRRRALLVARCPWLRSVSDKDVRVAVYCTNQEMPRALGGAVRTETEHHGAPTPTPRAVNEMFQALQGATHDHKAAA